MTAPRSTSLPTFPLSASVFRFPYKIPNNLLLPPLPHTYTHTQAHTDTHKSSPLTSTSLPFSLFRTTLHSTSAMTKISLLAALALACVCSALEVYTGENFQGDSCIFETPFGGCEKVPEPCYGRVSSMRIAPELLCRLFDSDACYGYPKETVVGDNFPAFYGLKSIKCWPKNRHLPGRD
ncbi:MAG: hypothetical protein J3Q66DRAFT_432210 [Benniella sp.]|nr:MAG: hypothetical protein J3Q66DRAFT_432210 [Benniella sp.]